MTRKLTFIMDGNFINYENSVYSPHMYYRAFAGRYVDAFSKISIYARAFDRPSATGELATGDGVSFERAPSQRGVKNYIKALPQIFIKTWNIISESDILLLRFPGNLSTLAMLICFMRRRKFCAEIVAEPKDYFTKNNGYGRLGFIPRWLHVSSTSIAAKKARVVRYVTEKYLQRSYPSAQNNIQVGFTDVYFNDFSAEKKIIGIKKDYKFRIVNVGMMHNDSKGHVDLIEACKFLKDTGLNFQCTLIGDGVRKPYYEGLVEKYDLGDYVKFTGVLSGGGVISDILLDSDLFILPSYQEGMPRSLLEAMYLHVPCLATAVGGVSEVLPQSSFIKMKNPADIAEKIRFYAQSNSNLIKLQEQIVNSISKFDKEYFKENQDELFSALKGNG